MLDVLVADDNYVFAKDLVNFVVAKNKEIRLAGIACNGEEAINLILEKKPEIILLDIKMPKKSGIDVLKEIEKIKEYNPYIIIISDFTYSDLYSEFKSVKRCLNKPINYEYLLRDLQHIDDEHEENKLYNYIAEDLNRYGFNKASLGYMYLREAIYIAIKYHNTLKNMQHDLFLKVANKYPNTSTNKVKWSISKLISNSIYNSKNYITSKNLILEVLENVKSKLDMQ